MISEISLHLSRRWMRSALLKSATMATVAVTATLLAKSEFSQEADVQSDVEFRLNALDDFDIEAGPLRDQLNIVLNARRVTYIYDFHNLDGIRGAAVHGQFSLDVALQKMFEGTGCSRQLLARSIEVFCTTHRAAAQLAPSKLRGCMANYLVVLCDVASQSALKGNSGTDATERILITLGTGEAPMTEKHDKDRSIPDLHTPLDIARRVSRLLDRSFISPLAVETDEYDGTESIEDWLRRRRGPEF